METHNPSRARLRCICQSSLLSTSYTLRQLQHSKDYYQLWWHLFIQTRRLTDNNDFSDRGICRAHGTPKQICEHPYATDGLDTGLSTITSNLEIFTVHWKPESPSIVSTLSTVGPSGPWVS